MKLQNSSILSLFHKKVKPRLLHPIGELSSLETLQAKSLNVKINSNFQVLVLIPFLKDNALKKNMKFLLWLRN